MKEARIECFVREWPLHDLGIVMRLGDVEFIAKERARKSKDLTEARRLKAVQVKYVERSRMAKKPPAPPRLPPPPNVRLKRARRKAPPAAVAPVLDMDEIRRIAREEARAGAREGTAEGVEEGVRKALEGFSRVGPAIDQDTLEAALRNVLPGITTGAPAAAARPSGPEEPVYIPKDIVNKDATAELKTQTSEGDDAGLGDAAAALKAAKGTSGRKRKSRKKPAPSAESKE